MEPSRRASQLRHGSNPPSEQALSLLESSRLSCPLHNWGLGRSGCARPPPQRGKPQSESPPVRERRRAGRGGVGAQCRTHQNAFACSSPACDDGHLGFRKASSCRARPPLSVSEHPERHPPTAWWVVVVRFRQQRPLFSAVHRILRRSHFLRSLPCACQL